MIKNQHYVSRFYLQNFADADGYLWVYDTQNGCVKRLQPNSICVENYLYETKFEDERAGKFVNPNELGTENQVNMCSRTKYKRTNPSY